MWWPWQKKRPGGPSYIGPGVCITGRIESQGELTIYGRVEGDIIHEGRLVIGAGAQVTSNVRATSMQVAGVVRGNLQVEETLELLATARLHGDIACVSLQVAQGAIFSGRNHMAGTELVPVAALPAPVRTVEEPVSAPLAILLEPVGIAEREVLGVATATPAARVEAPVEAPVAEVEAPTPVAEVEAPAPVAEVEAPAPVAAPARVEAPAPAAAAARVEAPAPVVRVEAPAFYGGFSAAVRSEAS